MNANKASHQFNAFIRNLADMNGPVPGVDRFLLQKKHGKPLRYAILTNDAARTLNGLHSRVALLQNGCRLRKIFSPEHGITAQGADGVFQKHSNDSATGLPVISLYGNKLAPDEEDMQDIDAILYDIPDVGCRFYTYLWTLTHVMEACSRHQKKLILLDRPNPIGGAIARAEGPILDELYCSSFIGRWAIPIRHSCSTGELALYFATKKNIDFELNIVPVKNWSRSLIAGTARFPFFPTSPAMTHVSAALLYPGTGLLEGMNVNEGRGTEFPFRQFGTPWADGSLLLQYLQQKNLPGIRLHSCSFTAASGLYRNEVCHGIRLVVEDPQQVRPVAAGITVLETLIHLYPGFVQERLYKTIANPSGKGHLDKLLGIKNAFACIQSGRSIDTDVSAQWPQEIQRFLLYPG